MPQAAFALRAGHFGSALEHNAVQRRVIRQRKGHFIGAGQSAGGRIQGADHLGIHMGLHLQNFIPLHQPHAGHAVGLALPHQRFQRGAVVLTEAQHQCAGTAVGHAQLLAQLRVHACALHVQARLQGAGMCVETRVHDAAVGLACSLGHVVGLFQHRDPAIIAAQHPRQSASNHAGAHNDDVGFQNKFPPFGRFHQAALLCCSIVPCF